MKISEFMKPKEKAIEIVNKYEQHLFNKFTQNEDWVKCTQSALIAVNEVIDQWIIIDTYLGNGQGQLNPNLKYWLSVKKEIKKL